MSQKSSIDPQVFLRLSRRIYDLSGIAFSEKKMFLMESRLKQRAAQLGLDRYEDYIAQLDGMRKGDPEWQHFINALTTNKTEWFREKPHFDFLREHLRSFVERNRLSRLRLWCAATSTGEEPYSLAIQIRAVMGESFPFEILATDIDTDALAAAKKGIYRIADINSVPVSEWNKSFLLGEGDMDGLVKVKQELSSKIRFEVFNLHNPQYNWSNAFDIIFVRNVFIYFKPEDITRIMQRLYGTCKPSAWVFVGHSESSAQVNTDWEYLAPAVYVKGQRAAPARTADAPEPPSTSSVKAKLEAPASSSESMSAYAEDPSKLAVAYPKEGGSTIHFWIQHEVVAILVSKIDHSFGPVMRAGKDALQQLITRLKGFRAKDWRVKLIFTPYSRVHERRIRQSMAEMGSTELETTTLKSNRAEFSVDPNTKKIRVSEDKLHRDVGYGVNVGSNEDQVAHLTGLSEQMVNAAASIFTSVIAIGSSTGGVEALIQIIPELPADAPPVFITQHIPKAFSGNLAEHLNRLSSVEVREAREGELVLPGRVYVAPGDTQMEVRKGDMGVTISTRETRPMSGHCPSVDYMFFSLAKVYASRVVSVVLTGMGNDGARGAQEIKARGGIVFAQDEATSLIYGMPKAVVDLGICDRVLPLGDIAYQVLQMARMQESKKRKLKQAS